MLTYLHVQDEDDLLALPLPLLDLIGTTYTLELKSHTYYEHGNSESFTCWTICEPNAIEEPPAFDESAGSSFLIETADDGKTELKKLTEDPLLLTPSTLSKDKRYKMLEWVTTYTSKLIYLDPIAQVLLSNLSLLSTLL